MTCDILDEAGFPNMVIGESIQNVVMFLDRPEMGQSTIVHLKN
jgi:hypothetical protein